MKYALNTEVVSLSEVPSEGYEASVERRRFDILVVDDERIIADSLTVILTRNGYCVGTAYDGVNALELIRAYPPKLVISDVIMPRMTGIELALTLQVLVPECRVLLFSGQASTADLLEKAREHDFTILNKPVHPTDMLRRVSEYVLPTRDAIYSMTN